MHLRGDRAQNGIRGVDRHNKEEEARREVERLMEYTKGGRRSNNIYVILMMFSEEVTVGQTKQPLLPPRLLDDHDHG